MRARRIRLLGLTLAVLLTTAACQTTPAPPPHGRMPVWDGGP